MDGRRGARVWETEDNQNHTCSTEGDFAVNTEKPRPRPSSRKLPPRRGYVALRAGHFQTKPAEEAGG